MTLTSSSCEALALQRGIHRIHELFLANIVHMLSTLGELLATLGFAATPYRRIPSQRCFFCTRTTSGHLSIRNCMLGDRHTMNFVELVKGTLEENTAARRREAVLIHTMSVG